MSKTTVPNDEKWPQVHSPISAQERASNAKTASNPQFEDLGS
jgi:hypothetical protein